MAYYKPDPDARPGEEGPMQPAGGPYVGRVEWAGPINNAGKPPRILCRVRPVSPEGVVRCAPLLVNLPAVGSEAQLKFLSVWCSALGHTEGFDTEDEDAIKVAMEGRFVMYSVKHKPFQGVDRAELDRLHVMDDAQRAGFDRWWSGTHGGQPSRYTGGGSGAGGGGPAGPAGGRVATDDDVPF